MATAQVGGMWAETGFRAALARCARGWLTLALQLQRHNGTCSPLTVEINRTVLGSACGLASSGMFAVASGYNDARFFDFSIYNASGSASDI